MSEAAPARAAGAGQSRAWIVVLAVLLLTLLLFVAGNAHLLYVAMDSAPACVDHVKVGQDAGGFSAAQSAC